MTFTYTMRPDDNKLDEVRFLIQDTEDGTHLIENEEILYLIKKYGGSTAIADCNMNAVCAAACVVMAAKWARKQEVRTSNYNSNNDNVHSKLLSQAKYFRNNAITSSSFIVPSISISDKEINEDDTDATKPSFVRNILDDPQLSDVSVSELENLT